MTRLDALSANLSADTAMLISAPHHLRYLTGFPAGESWIFLTTEAAYFLTDFRYIEQAEQTVRGAECRMIVRLPEELKTLAERHGIRTILVEAEQTSAARLQHLRT